MRTGLHITEQEAINSSVQQRLRQQTFVVIACLVLGVMSLLVLLWMPRQGRAPYAVARVQSLSNTLAGAGVLVANGFVVTSGHLVGQNGEMLVGLPNRQPVTAKVAFVDTDRDIAVLQLPDAVGAMSVIPLGDSDAVAADDAALVVGYPADTYSETNVIVTVMRDSGLLQTTAGSNPGNSGGPLIRSSDGAIVGIMTSTAEMGGAADAGQHRATPINAVKQVSRQRGFPID